MSWVLFCSHIHSSTTLQNLFCASQKPEGNTGTYMNVSGPAMVCSLLLYLTLFLLFQALRSFKLTVTVDPKYHPKIIGRKGAVITQIRTEHEVNIQFPDKDDESQVRGQRGVQGGLLVVSDRKKDSIFSRALNSLHCLWIRWRVKRISREKACSAAYEPDFSHISLCSRPKTRSPSLAMRRTPRLPGMPS